MENKSWISKLSLLEKGLLTVGSLLVAGTVWGATLPPSSTTPPKPEVPIVQENPIETKTVEENVVIPYESKTVNSSILLRGVTKITQAGKSGEKTIKYEVQFKDGVEISRKQIDETVTVQPTTQITSIGTKDSTPVFPPSGSGYYNSDGVWVPSPDSNISNASALCRDGTYSHSLHRQGTCSGHGGVSQWL